jgi:Flp pilus assembly protein TadG
MAAAKRWTSFQEDTRGYAVVEATILFPIIIMIFTGLVLLAMYLPTRMVLQQATQYTATALATEHSDTWLDYDSGRARYSWKRRLGAAENVYFKVISSMFSRQTKSDAVTSVETMESKSLVSRSGKLEVSCEVCNYIVYKEIAVTATRTIPVPVDLSFVRFPTEIPITVTSTAVVLDGDEFVRNMDMAADFITYLDQKYGLGLDKLSGVMDKVYELLGV